MLAELGSGLLVRAGVLASRGGARALAAAAELSRSSSEQAQSAQRGFATGATPTSSSSRQPSSPAAPGTERSAQGSRPAAGAASPPQQQRASGSSGSAVGAADASSRGAGASRAVDGGTVSSGSDGSPSSAGAGVPGAWGNADSLPGRAPPLIRTLVPDVPLPSWIRSAPPRPRRAPVPVTDAIREVKAKARARFDETVELALKLGTDPRRGDQQVRSAAVLPHGTGKAVRVAVFARGEDAEAARAAGADVVGAEDLIDSIATAGGGGLTFDKAVATPELMPRLGKVARILGPRGLMPNPKLGTVTADVAAAVRLVKQGRVEFRADRGAVLHAGCGKVSFSEEALAGNVGALVAAVIAARPRGIKGSGLSGYVLTATLSTTMGPGVPVAPASLADLAAAARAR